MKEFYFSKFEHRVPYKNAQENPVRDILFQFVSLLTIISGLIYFHWRCISSINFDVLVFSFTLIIAETLSFIGICLFIFDRWPMKGFKKQAFAAFFLIGKVSELLGSWGASKKETVNIISVSSISTFFRSSFLTKSRQ